MNEQSTGKTHLYTRMAPWLLITVGALVYANSLEGPFIFDDLGAIVGNPDIRHLWPLWQDPDSTPRPSLNGRPVVKLSLALNYAIGGLDVRWYHAVNIALHIGCALVLCSIVRRTLLGAYLRDRFAHTGAGLALASALLWMLHPLNNQCVNYILQRSESLMGLFYLLTLYCAIRAFAAVRPARWYGASILSCALGMASKEVMVTAPLMILLYDRVFQAASWRQIWCRRRGLYAGLAASWMVLAALLSSGPHGDSVGFSSGVSAWNYALNQCVMIAGYLQKAFWPHPLILDYGFPHPLSIGAIWPSAAVLLALLVLVAAALWQRPAIGFLGAWFFAILGPTSSLVPLVNEVGAERRMYLSLAALIVFVLIIGERPRRRGVVLVLAAAVALGYGTVQRNRDYRSSMAIWQTVVEAVPLNPRALTYLGLAHYEQGKAQEAIEHYGRALRLKPDYAEAHNNLGIALGSQGQVEMAVHHFRQTVQLEPGLVEGHNNLGNALVTTGRLDEAIEYYARALRLKPDYAEAHNNLGIALGLQGRVEEAIRHFQQALELKPDYNEARNNLGIALRSRDQD